MKVLLVEDDLDLASALKDALRHENYLVSHAKTAKDALEQIKLEVPDILVLDLGLPDMDGSEVLKSVRKKQQDIPILILTARGGVTDKVSALDLGADDYLSKPFEIAELFARLRAMGRRLVSATSSIITIGSVALDTAGFKLFIDDNEIKLSKKEFVILKCLMEDAGRVKTKEMIENRLYQWGDVIGSNTVEVHVNNLRKKLPKDFINTVRGIGYTVQKD